MRASEIEWITSEDMRKQLNPYVLPALRYLAPWVQSLTIRYDPATEHLLLISSSPEYRHARILVGDGWFAEGDKERRVAFRHEMLHTHIEGLSVVFTALLDALKPSEELATWAREQWRRAEEGMICDLSRQLPDG